MRKKIKIIELFSGIGGFSKGLEQAGFEIEKHYFSEIDKHAIANYKYNYPNAEYIGSVVDIRPRDFRDIDIITFGSPCQDFSLAGKRKGLEGERSSLIEYAIRAITDIRPSVFIWENVKGAFSSNSGADFWAILQAFANIGNYRLEWQLLNTKWFLPQNRERIYLIGHLADRSEPGVFPITEDDKIYNEGRQIKKETNGCASALMANHFQSQRGNFVDVKTLQGSDTLNTIRSGGRGSLTDKHSWDIVQIGAFRGRNPENPKSRESGLPTEQMLEINKEGVSNALTSVQKDNVVIQLNPSLESGGKQPYQQNRIYDEKGISPCLMKEKSDLLIGTWRTHKDGNGFREIKENKIRCKRYVSYWNRSKETRHNLGGYRECC
jgi:DNA (cytosine-5)-methyltransferase 1